MEYEMSDIKREGVFADINILSENTKKLVEKTDSIKLRLKTIEDNIDKLKDSCEDDEIRDLYEQILCAQWAAQELLVSKKRLAREYDFALSTYKETEQKSKDIIKAITF